MGISRDIESKSCNATIEIEGGQVLEVRPGSGRTARR
jgi:hypothetical protein